MRRVGSGDKGAGRAAWCVEYRSGCDGLSCRTGRLRVGRSLRDLCPCLGGVRGLVLPLAGGRSVCLVGAGWGFAGLHLFQEPDDADAEEAEEGEPTEDVDKGPEGGLAT